MRGEPQEDIEPLLITRLPRPLKPSHIEPLVPSPVLRPPLKRTPVPSSIRFMQGLLHLEDLRL